MKPEDTQVLNTDPDAAANQPQPTAETPVDDAVITSSGGNMYQKAASKVSQPVGEADHASEISTNINRENYVYKSPIDQSAEPQVTTTSNAKGNVTPEPTVWKSEYAMDDKYKATTEEDYSWNKLAAERAQYTYLQEESQVLSEYAKSQQQIRQAAATAMDTYFAAKYSGAQTKDKMGWSGGSETSNDLKIAFLQAETAAGMYSQQELQRYGVESQLSVARLYSEASKQALALEMYQDAVNLAVQEAELTGWYIAPEAGEIMKQQSVAKQILAKATSTAGDKARAQRVISAGNAYFDDLGFSKDEHGNYIGVETLSRLEYLETVRANKASEALQAQANKIAQQQANTAAASLRAAQIQFEWTKNQVAIQNFRDAEERLGYDKDGRPNFYNTGGGQGGYHQVTLSSFPAKSNSTGQTVGWMGYQTTDAKGNRIYLQWDGSKYNKVDPFK